MFNISLIDRKTPESVSYQKYMISLPELVMDFIVISVCNCLSVLGGISMRQLVH